MSRALGVDYGAKRVGIAVSDPLRLTAQPLEVVATAEAVGRITALVEALDVDTIVLGLPTTLGGREGDSALKARAMGEELSASGAAVVYTDERFTSRMAGAVMLEAGERRRSRREKVDKVAAALILQSYLDSHPSGNAPPAPDVEHPDTP